MSTIARIISCGDELMLGRLTDTNGGWLARELSDAGWTVAGIAVAGDAQAGLESAMRAALVDASLVVVSGGLGPTDDDRTRHALAAVAGKELRFDARAWKAVLAWYTRHRPDLVVPESNRRQALIPRGGRQVPNDRGTAPGVLLRIGAATVVLLPGPPSEMRPMWHRLAPKLIAEAGLQPPSIRELFMAGVGESQVQDALPGLLTESDPMVGITFSEHGHLTLRIVGAPRTVAARAKEIAPRIAAWRIPEASLAASILAVLAKRQQTLALAESLTGGNVTARLCAIPGASRVLVLGTVAYQEKAKIAALGVDPVAIRRHGVVSEEVACAMAEGARSRSGATWGVATTGLAGPDDGGTGLPVGTVWVAVAGPDGTTAKTTRLEGSRERIQGRAATSALNLLWARVATPGPRAAGALG